MNLNFGLESKVAVVTGGAGMLCSEISKALSDSGAKVAILDLFEEKAKDMAEIINKSGGEAFGVGVDVLNKESIEKAAEAVITKWGRVDILVNGAGGNKPQATTGEKLSFFDLPQDAVQWVFNLNLMGTIMPSQVFGRYMANQKGGCILNISSMAAFTPLTKTVAYSAAKAGISNFTQWLAVHLSQEYSPEIRVNAIAPGFLLTQQNRFLLTNEDGSSTERGKKILGNTPMGRYGEPNELTGAVVYLCSDAASFVTGVVLPIDGGFSAFSGV
jgi:NAD(P)-dependent dehydrogenase (short-subunit alcohol dehydrogenase family)